MCCCLSLLCLQPPNSSKEVLPLRPGPASNGTQPVNIVRPLRPAPSPQGGSRDLKVVRPPLPTGRLPVAPTKSPPTPQRISPPRRPLPLNPTRSPLVRPPLTFYYSRVQLFYCSCGLQNKNTRFVGQLDCLHPVP